MDLKFADRVLIAIFKLGSHHISLFIFNKQELAEMKVRFEEKSELLLQMGFTRVA